MKCSHMLAVLFILAISSVGCQDKVSDPSGTQGGSNSSAKTIDKKDLTRETVLYISHDKARKEVEILLPTYTTGVLPFINLPEYGDADYRQLIEANVISCQYVAGAFGGKYQNCRPSSGGNDLKPNNSTSSFYDSLILVIGYKVPSEVTGISRIDQSTALADVVLSFEPSAGNKLYEKYKPIFIRVGLAPGYTPAQFKPSSLGKENARVFLRLFDDGWRVERMD